MAETPSHCSPSRYCTYRKTGSCLTPEDLRKVLRYAGVPVPQGSSTIHSKLLSLVHALLDGGPKRHTGQALPDELLEYVKDPLLRRHFQKVFRPTHPRAWLTDRNSWLSSDDIDDVMKQYEHAYSDFKFVGVFPVDFEERPSHKFGRCVSPEMCALKVEQHARVKDKTHMGVVLNLDTHDGRGSHWVAVYIGLDPQAKNYGVFYYDSVANPPPLRIASWMRTVARTMANFSAKPFRVAHNKVRRQFGHSECGVFSMIFIIACVQRNATFDRVCKSIEGDSEMNSMRSVLYRPPSTTVVTMGARPTGGALACQPPRSLCHSQPKSKPKPKQKQPSVVGPSPPPKFLRRRIG